MPKSEPPNSWPFRYCPACGREGVLVLHAGKEYRCSACSYDYFHNTAAAAGLVLLFDGRLVLLRRRYDPARGKLALPGGFIDPSESAEEALVRECREETGIELNADALRYLASYPNYYEYRSVPYATCDLFFLAQSDSPPGQPMDDEAEELMLVDPKTFKPEALAFPSARRLFSERLSGFSWQTEIMR